jgi:hypothetical protein
VQSSEVLRDQLTVAEVAWRSEPDPQPLAEQHADLIMLLAALGQHPMVKTLGLGGAVSDQSSLASQLAYLLPFEARQKIELLGLDEPAQQLEQIQSLLEQLQDGA